jgi:hypothetical protein
MQIVTSGETIDIHPGALYVELSYSYYPNVIRGFEVISEPTGNTSERGTYYCWTSKDLEMGYITTHYGVTDSALGCFSTLYNVEAKNYDKMKEIFKHRFGPILQKRVVPAKKEDTSIDIGCGMVMKWGEKSITLINTLTGKERVLVSADRNVLVDDSEIDFDAIHKEFEYYGHADSKEAPYCFGRYSNFENGICALQWTICPDGFYFRDEDGFGAEDNDEEVVYCVINTDLEIIVPFQPMADVREVLKELSSQQLAQNKESKSHNS